MMGKTNDPLDELLKQARVPARSEGYWERFPKRVTTRLREGTEEDTSRTRRVLSLAWGFGIAAICLLVALGIWSSQRNPSEPTHKGNEFADNRKLYREVAALFPNRVRAITIDKNGAQLDLSDMANVPSSTPLLLNICRADNCRKIITFSGQQIQINGEMCEVLLDAQGHVIVVGPHLIWSSAEPTRAEGRYRIDAQPLGAS